MGIALLSDGAGPLARKTEARLGEAALTFALIPCTETRALTLGGRTRSQLPLTVPNLSRAEGWRVVETLIAPFTVSADSASRQLSSTESLPFTAWILAPPSSWATLMLPFTASALTCPVTPVRQVIPSTLWLLTLPRTCST